MGFAQLIFLFGSLAVAGPVIAHLLAKPKYRRLPFTMLRFLHSEQAQSRSRRKLRDLLILLLRCAIIVLIAMLFAQPGLLIEVAKEEPRPLYCLGLDNSMSMSYSDGTRSYVEVMIDLAGDYIRSADDDGLFNICALASSDWLEDLSREQALAEIKNLKIAPGSADIDNFLAVVDRAKQNKHLIDEVSVLIISDFTPAVMKQLRDVVEPAAVDNIDYKSVISAETINNAAVIDAHAGDITDGKLTVNAAVINYGRVEQNRWLSLKTGKKTLASVEVKLRANQRRTYQLQTDIDDAGRKQLFLPMELGLSAGDGLRDDDTFYLALSVPAPKNVKVLLVDNGRGEMFLFKAALDALSQVDSYNTISVKHISYRNCDNSDFIWADVIVCSEINRRLDFLASNLKNFTKAGGKIIFFVNDEPLSPAARRLWDQGLLAAMPTRCIRERTYIEPAACASGSLETDPAASKSLTNYRIDRILLSGYLQCRPHPQSICTWRLQNQTGFIFVKRLGKGSSIFVNTSADDSLGSLTKSRASLAFCQYLLGRNNSISEYVFACNERAMLPALNTPAMFLTDQSAWVKTCNGQNYRAAVAQSSLLVPDPAGIGWIKTLNRPVRYAGINPPRGETDMTKPDRREIDDMIKRAFHRRPASKTAAAQVFREKKYEPLWEIFAWLLIMLLLAEAAVTNRLKR